MSVTEVITITMIVFFAGNFFGFIYSMVVLKTNLFAKYRIQTKPYAKGVFMDRLPLYLFNFFVLGTVGAGGAYALYAFDCFDTGWPTIWVFAGQVVFSFLIDDIYFYFMHRQLHRNKFLLKKIHSIHHRAHTPFPLEYLYVHPLEWMLGTIGPLLGYLLIIIVMPLNIYAFWAFVVLRNLHEIHIHSDLNLPILKNIPLVSHVEDHDIHHARLDGNYASTFRIWDWILKTRFDEDKKAK